MRKSPSPSPEESDNEISERTPQHLSDSFIIQPPLIQQTIPPIPISSSTLTLAKMGTDPPTSSKLKLNKPPEFDGSSKHYHSWIQKVELFIRGNKITEDEEKILITLSFMTSGPALDWCQAFADEALQGTGFGTWAEFRDKLNH